MSQSFAKCIYSQTFELKLTRAYMPQATFASNSSAMHARGGYAAIYNLESLVVKMPFA